MNYWIRGAWWAGIYLGLVFTPLLVLFLGRVPSGRGVLWDGSSALGFAAAAMLGSLFILVARLRRATLPFGIDVVIYFHRQAGLVATGFVLLHVIFSFTAEPALFSLLDPAGPVWPLRTGLAALTALIALVGTSVWRKALRIPYDVWRVWHAVLAVLAFVLAVAHMVGVGYYTGTPLVQGVWILIAASLVALVIYTRVVSPAMDLRHPYLVREVRPERGNAWTLVLEPEGHSGLCFEPGQFAWLTLGSSPFSFREHPFSIASDAGRPDRICFTIKELGDFTSRIGETPVGERAYLDGPYGALTPDRHDAPGYILIAGGIGIVPMVGMLRTFEGRRDRRPITLIYGYSSWDRVTLREELERLKGTLNLQVVYVLQDPPEGWTGETGVLREELLERYLPDYRSGREYFVCGPVPMKEAVERSLYRQRVPLHQVHSELYDLA